MLLSESNKKRLQELSGIMQEKGGIPRTVSLTSKKSAKYRNPKGSAKYFKAYKKDDNLKEISLDQIVVKEKYIHENLNKKIWKDGNLKPKVRKKLLKIAKEFYDFLKTKAKIKGIIFTGSMANYNWTNGSDIDLHLLIDYDEVDENRELVEEYLRAKKSIWNDRHKILIYGHDVELYAQDEKEAHHSTGVYDILNDKWIIEPEHKKFSIDKQSVKIKAKDIIDSIEEMQRLKDPDSIYESGQKIKEKIKKMRTSGLEERGEFSVENLAFKYLRNNGYLKTLFDATRKAYDEMLSLNEENKFIKNNDIFTDEHVLLHIHDMYDNFKKEGLKDMILKYPFYKLTEISLNNIDLHEWHIDESKVDKYIKMYQENKNYTPIVYDKENESIIDGIHRANALDKIGKDTIKAYVGIYNIENEKNTGEKELKEGLDECNLKHTSDKTREIYLKKALNSKEVPSNIYYYKEDLEEELHSSNDLIVVASHGDYICYYELFVDNCWEDLFHSEKYKNLEIKDSVSRLVEKKFSKIIESVGQRIIDWSWDDDSEILSIKITNKKNIMKEEIIRKEIRKIFESMTSIDWSLIDKEMKNKNYKNVARIFDTTTILGAEEIVNQMIDVGYSKEEVMNVVKELFGENVPEFFEYKLKTDKEDEELKGLLKGTGVNLNENYYLKSGASLKELIETAFADIIEGDVMIGKSDEKGVEVVVFSKDITLEDAEIGLNALRNNDVLGKDGFEVEKITPNVMVLNIKKEKIERPEYSDNINEKSVSKSQQRFMGQVHAIQTGQLGPKDLNPKYRDAIMKVAKSMKKKDAKDFAKTKHKNIPETIKEDSELKKVKNILKIDKDLNSVIESIDSIKEFIICCGKELKIKEPFVVCLKSKRGGPIQTTASYNTQTHEINIYCKGRHIIDILRSIAHEIRHMKQNIDGELNYMSGEDGSPEENQAHSFSGLMIRKYGRKNPKIYENYSPVDKSVI